VPAGPYTETVRAQRETQVIRPDAVQAERHDPVPSRALPPGDAGQQRQMRNLPQPVDEETGQRFAMRGDPADAELVDEVQCRAERSDPRQVRRPALQALGHPQPPQPALMQPDVTVAAGQERRQFRVNSLPGIEHARPRDAKHLVRGEHHEVGTQRGHIQRHVPSALGAVCARG